MKEIYEYTPDEILPDIDTILKRQGIPPDNNFNDKIMDIANEALATFNDYCDASLLLAEISLDEFVEVYDGEGQNSAETPVGEIYPHADQLALFAITVGERVSEEINALFERKDFALAAMLDTVASEATEKAGILTEGNYLKRLLDEAGTPKELSILRYSPGYCGWHISGQKKLFEFLEPEQIGITLTDSFLMQPLKSISGVMIAGRPEIHQFEISYPFCDNCLTKECRGRINTLVRR